MNTLTQRSTVRQLVAAFASAEADVRAAFGAIVAAEERVNVSFSMGDATEGRGAFRVDAGKEFSSQFRDPDHAIDLMARKAWRAIVERLEIRRIMTPSRWEAMEERLTRGDLPPITEAAVLAFVEEHAASIPEMATEAVGEVYEWLRRCADPAYSGEYKTNDKHSRLEVGATIILPGMVEKSGRHKGRFEVRDRMEPRLTALENVFTALDGTGMVSRGYYSALQTAIHAVESGGRGETPLFRFRACGNGNLHLEFRRLDLLRRFNQMAGGMRLKPAAAA